VFCRDRVKSLVSTALELRKWLVIMGGVIDLVNELKHVDTLVVSYHGVVATPVVPRYRAVADPRVLELFRTLRGKYTVVLATFRSYSAVASIAEAFDALLCCNGCEIVTPDIIVIPRNAEEYTHRVLEISRHLKTSADYVVELRRTRFGDAVGLSIEWNGDVKAVSREVIEIAMKMALDRGLRVYCEERAKFVEIYAPICSRRRALEILRKLLGLGRVAFVSDCFVDAEVADIVDLFVFVRHELNEGTNLDAHTIVTRQELLEALRRIATS